LNLAIHCGAPIRPVDRAGGTGKRLILAVPHCTKPFRDKRPRNSGADERVAIANNGRDRAAATTFHQFIESTVI
jgi:hypothetical protein